MSSSLNERMFGARRMKASQAQSAHGQDFLSDIYLYGVLFVGVAGGPEVPRALVLCYDAVLLPTEQPGFPDLALSYGEQTILGDVNGETTFEPGGIYFESLSWRVMLDPSFGSVAFIYRQA